MSVQTIDIKGNKAVVLPVEEYNELIERAAMLGDVEAYDAAMARQEAGEESFPAEVVNRILEGTSPIKVFREYRQLSQEELAQRIGVSASAISQIEKKGTNSVKTLKAIAGALGLELEDLT